MNAAAAGAVAQPDGAVGQPSRLLGCRPPSPHPCSSRACQAACASWHTTHSSRQAVHPSPPPSRRHPTCCVERERVGGLAVNRENLIPRLDTRPLRWAAGRGRHHHQRAVCTSCRVKADLHAHPRHRAGGGCPANTQGSRVGCGRVRWGGMVFCRVVQGGCQGSSPCPYPSPSRRWWTCQYRK